MKKWISILIVLIFGIYLTYNYIYQDHRDIKTERAEFSLSSIALFEEFTKNAVNAEKKYLNKTIKITGPITEVNANSITLNNTVFCVLNSLLQSKLTIGKPITIKGRFIGYDDLLEQIKIDQSTILN